MTTINQAGRRPAGRNDSHNNRIHSNPPTGTTPTQNSNKATQQKDSPLYLIQSKVHQPSLQAWMAHRGFTDINHALHSLLVENLGRGLAPNPFRYMESNRDAYATIYGYTSHHGEELQDAMEAFADPERELIMPPDQIQSKLMRTDFPNGALLGFEIKLRPVIRVPGDRGRTWEIDAYHHYLNEREANHKADIKHHAWTLSTWDEDPENEGLEKPRTPVLSPPDEREVVYAEFLRHLLDRQGSCALERAVRRIYKRTMAVRQLGAVPSEGPEVVYFGNMRVIDEDKVGDLLRRGIGRHRTYGYGMLLLKPPG